MSTPSHSSARVWPLRSPSRSSSARRVGSASALNTASMPSISCSHLAACQAYAAVREVHMDIERLEPLREDWERALCVVAHPDDMEFGAAAAVARWTAQGKQVVYCMLTSGEAGIDGMAPDRSREVREAEQVESARIVGVDKVDFLRLKDGVLEYGVALRRA